MYHKKSTQLLVGHCDISCRPNTIFSKNIVHTRQKYYIEYFTFHLFSYELQCLEARKKVGKHKKSRQPAESLTFDQKKNKKNKNLSTAHSNETQTTVANHQQTKVSKVEFEWMKVNKSNLRRRVTCKETQYQFEDYKKASCSTYTHFTWASSLTLKIAERLVHTSYLWKESTSRIVKQMRGT